MEALHIHDVRARLGTIVLGADRCLAAIERRERLVRKLRRRAAC